MSNSQIAACAPVRQGLQDSWRGRRAFARPSALDLALALKVAHETLREAQANRCAAVAQCASARLLGSALAGAL